jgi:hypothetical protein
MDAESLVKELILKSMTPEQQQAILDSVKNSVAQARAVQKQKIGENVDLVVQALKKIESDIRSRYDDLGNLIEKRVASIQDGRDGINGTDGRDGRDGKPGKDGASGRQGAQGPAGKDGRDGVDGISVANAYLDFDGGLVITLSNGNEINVGEIMPMELASQIKVITNGGGTSQYVLDTLESLQTQINSLIPSQTGNSGKFLTTNGTSTSWASVAGGLSYQGTWNASTNTPTLASSTGTNGYYYIVSTAGSTNLNGITDWQIGDWLLFNGSVWQKIDQSELVTSVAGRTGAVTLSTSDISGLGTIATQDANNVAITGGTESAVSHSGDTISNYLNWTSTSAPSYQEGRVWYDSTAKALAYYNDVSTVQVHVGHDIQFKVINNTGSTIPNGSPVYITSTSSGQTYPNVALAKADVAATSTVIGLTDGAITNGSVGYVTSVGNIDNVNTASFTVGQVLYLSPYSAGQLMNTIPPTGITVQVGMVTFVNSSTGKIYVKQTTPLNVPASIISGAVAIVNGGTGATTASDALTNLGAYPASNPSGYTNNTGTVTSVTGSAPIASSGGNTPAISLASNYGDTQNPYASKTANYVLAAPNGSSGAPTFRAIVAADIPTLNQNTTGTASNVTGIVAVANGGTGTDTPSIVAGSNITVSGTWPNQTIAATSSGSGTVTSVAASVPSFLSISGSPITTSGTLAISYSGTALPIANGGTGVTSTPTDGQLLIGNGTGYTAATLTAGSNITITNSSGGITIASSGGGGGSLFFPFYKADGTSDTISLVSGTALPFFNSSGTAKNIALTT